MRTKDGQSTLTEPLFNDLKHFIPDLGATVVVVRVMERLNNLTKGQHCSIKRKLISSTLLITSSGFELFDQAFDQIQNTIEQMACWMTDLDNEFYAVLDNNLCNLASWLVQNDPEVILCGVNILCASLNIECTLERTLWVGSEAFGSLNT